MSPVEALPLAVVVAAVAALISTAVACQDNEQRARAIGTTARDAVSARCTPHAGDAVVASGAGDDEACADQACRDECGRRDVPRGFTQACLDTCRQTAICATDADCGPGKRCVAIAPVVRRCANAPAP